jgi:hypothetical protein
MGNELILKPRGAGLILAYVIGKRILILDIGMESDVDIRTLLISE